MTRESPASSKKSLNVRRRYVCVVRHTVAMTLPLKKLKVSSKGLNKRVLEQSGDGPLERIGIVLNEKVYVTSNKRGFRSKNYSVATYEQFKEGLSNFYPKRKVKTDGIQTQPPKL